MFNIKDDDDRSYNASVELQDDGRWYPEWKGPDDGAFEEWIEYLRQNGESMTTDEDIELPEFTDNDFPF